MSSPAAVLVCNGAIHPHTPPSAIDFLDSTPALTPPPAARSSGGPATFAESAGLHARSHPHLLELPRPRAPAFFSGTGSGTPLIHSLVNPSVRVAIHEMRGRLPVIKDEDLALTALVRGGGSCSSDGFNVFVHVGTYTPPVFVESGAGLAMAGRGRDAAAAKYAPWVRMQKNMEKMRPPGITELLLTNEGSHP